MNDEPEIESLAVIEKASRTDRFLKSEAARTRRKEARTIVDSHVYKADKEDRERLKAKRQMEKLQRKKQRRESIAD